MKRGDIVNIYEWPRSEKSVEGKVVLVKLIIKARYTGDLEYWKVKFLGSKKLFYRFILPQK